MLFLQVRFVSGGRKGGWEWHGVEGWDDGEEASWIVRRRVKGVAKGGGGRSKEGKQGEGCEACAGGCRGEGRGGDEREGERLRQLKTY